VNPSTLAKMTSSREVVNTSKVMALIRQGGSASEPNIHSLSLPNMGHVVMPTTTHTLLCTLHTWMDIDIVAHMHACIYRPVLMAARCAAKTIKFIE